MKFSFLIFVTYLVFSFSLHTDAQNTKFIDSLKQELKSRKVDDSVKVQILSSLYNAYLYNDLKKSKNFALKELELSNKIGFDKGIAQGLYHLAVYYNNIDLIDSSRIYYNKSLKVFEQTQNLSGLTGVNHGLAILEYSEGNYNKAINILDKNIDIYKNKLNDSSGLAITYDLKGSIFMFMGNHNIALKETLKALKILEEIDEPIRKADALNHLASIEFYLNNFEKSIEYNNQALKTYQDKNDNYYEAQALNDIGNTYYYLKDYNKAIELLNKSLLISTKMNIIILEATSLNNLGKCYTELGKFDMAENYLNNSLIILNKTNNKNKIVEILNDFGRLYNAKNKPEKAIPLFNRSIAIADTIQARENLRIGYFNRSNSYFKQQKFEKALIDYKLFKTISDSILNKNKSQQIEELKTIYNTEKKESEIALQKQEIEALNTRAKNDKLTKTLYGIGMFSFITISGLIYFGFKQRIKKNLIEREKQEAIYKQEIEFKQKELASQTLHLVQKNTFIQELKENLEKIKQSPELFKVEFRRLVMLLKKESAEDKDWEVFKSYFSEVHNNFDLKLKDIYPEITEKEIRLASFLRMNLSTKEIASMINVLPESVSKSKYRLKKKLNLDKETDLDNFLEKL